MTTTMNRVLKTLLAAIAMCLAFPTATDAQGRIEEQIRDLESKNVMTDKIVKRDPATRRVGMETKSFHFYSQGGTVADALREAFEAEARSATNVEREQRGESYECVLTFVQGTTRTVYRLSISGDKQRPEVDVQTYFRDESVNIDESSVETIRANAVELAAACHPAATVPMV